VKWKPEVIEFTHHSLCRRGDSSLSSEDNSYIYTNWALFAVVL